MRCFVPMLALVLCSGCYFYKTVNVIARDIETTQPLTSGSIRINYLTYLDLFPPSEREFRIDQDGIARVKIARGREDSIGIQLSSDQYRGFYLTDAGSAISPGVFMFGIPPRLHMHRPNTKPWPKSVVLEAWKQPDPRFEVTIADDFRGHLLLNPTPFELIELAPGQRIVQVRPNPHGVVTLPLTRPILASMGDVDVRFESGAAVPRAIRQTTDRASTPSVDATVIAVRYGSGGVFIGTRAEAEAAGYPQPKR